MYEYEMYEYEMNETRIFATGLFLFFIFACVTPGRMPTDMVRIIKVSVMAS